MKEEVENTIATPETTAPSSNQDKGSGFADFNFSPLQKNMAKWLPQAIAVFIVCLVYIFNSHRGMKLMREADSLRREIKELRAEYISLKSEQEYRSKLSQVADKLAERELKELRTPPFVIHYTKKDRKP